MLVVLETRAEVIVMGDRLGASIFAAAREIPNDVTLWWDSPSRRSGAGPCSTPQIPAVGSFRKNGSRPGLGDEVPQHLGLAEAPAALLLIQPLLRTVLCIVDALFVARQSAHLLFIQQPRSLDGRLDLLLLE